MIERELKYMLTKYQHHHLRDFILNYYKYQFERVKQVNYYYDTQDFFYDQRRTTIRIRRKNGILSGTVKVHSADEPDHSDEFLFDVSRIPTLLTYENRILHLKGGLVTYRLTVPVCSGVILYLDENHYQGHKDYEFEIEYHEESYADAWKALVGLTVLLGHCFDPNQCFHRSTPKSNRFFKRLKKLKGGIR